MRFLYTFTIWEISIRLFWKFYNAADAIQCGLVLHYGAACIYTSSCSSKFSCVKRGVSEYIIYFVVAQSSLVLKRSIRVYNIFWDFNPQLKLLVDGWIGSSTFYAISICLYEVCE